MGIILRITDCSTVTGRGDRLETGMWRYKVGPFHCKCFRRGVATCNVKLKHKLRPHYVGNLLDTWRFTFLRIKGWPFVHLRTLCSRWQTPECHINLQRKAASRNKNAEGEKNLLALLPFCFLL